MKHHHLRLLPLLLLPLAVGCGEESIEPFGPVPTAEQLAWQRMEINMFCHFGPNTFSGAEWGTGREDAETFRPRALDCAQWVYVAQQAGMGGIILTAKHHDGFCLWPSAFSTHTVADSLDVLRALRNAVDAHNNAGGTPALQMGVYISPWDRNHPTYGTDSYNDVFVNTLQEVHSKYGPMFEQWFDGACGEGPNGKQQRYDWPRFMQTMHELNPGCVIFSDIGPGCRWVGNEEGRAGETCWSTLCTEGATPSENKPLYKELVTGHSLSALRSPLSTLSWVPAEADVSIRPGWFWHPQEHPKTVDELMEIYFNSVGRNGLLLLNVPPDTNGRICPEDSAVLVAFRAERDRIFSKDLAQGAKIEALCEYGDGMKDKTDRRHPASNLTDTAYHSYWTIRGKDTSHIILVVQLPEVQEVDMVMLQEYIPLGQRVSKFSISYAEPDVNGGGIIAEGTTIGYKRIVRFPFPIRTNCLRIHIHALAPPILNRIAIYNSKAQ
ncbi:MAG: alpha-L-fucosidase [Bacteroidales bacterium]|nr:alpha-L-fucosidase [Bacteroidales bacterium]